MPSTPARDRPTDTEEWSDTAAPLLAEEEAEEPVAEVVEIAVAVGVPVAPVPVWVGILAPLLEKVTTFEE